MQFRFAGDTDMAASGRIRNSAGQPVPADPLRDAHGGFGWRQRPGPLHNRSGTRRPRSPSTPRPTRQARRPTAPSRCTSPVDPRFGLRQRAPRRARPVRAGLMRASRRASGESFRPNPIAVSVWVVAPTPATRVAVFMPVPPDSRFPTGINPDWPGARAFPPTRARVAALQAADPAKIPPKRATTAPHSVWADTRQLLRIAVPRVARRRLSRRRLQRRSLRQRKSVSLCRARDALAAGAPSCVARCAERRPPPTASPAAPPHPLRG